MATIPHWVGFGPRAGKTQHNQRFTIGNLLRKPTLTVGSFLLTPPIIWHIIRVMEIWLNELRNDIGEYGMFWAVQIFDLHATWKTGMPAANVAARLRELRPSINP